MAGTDYRKIFLEEMEDRLAQIEKELVGLENSPHNSRAQESLFRHYHSIKGMCASMGYRKMMRFAHTQEALLSAIRDRRIRASEEVVSALFSALDVMKDMTGRIARGESHESVDTSAIESVLEAALSGSLKKPPSPEKPLKAPKVSTTHTTTMKVEGWLFDELLRATAGLLTVLSELKGMAEPGRGNIQMRDAIYRFESYLKDINLHILSARLVPLSLVTDGLPRMVRELSHQMGKKVELNIEGDDTRLDKSVLESLSDTLVHILRNAIDHGIEQPQERLAKGKPECGNIAIRAGLKRDRVVIEISDDGRGIDVDRLVEKAVGCGIPRARIESMAEDELLMLVCTPGLSLKDTTTEVSGRGVGMDAVRDRVVSVGGRLSIESEPGKGTTIRLEFPQMASIVRVLFIESGGELFALPLKDVVALLEASPQWVERGRVEFRGTEIPARRLADVLAMPYNSISYRPMDAIVIEGEDHQPCALLVDAVTDEAEAYIKPLPQPVALIKMLRGYVVGADGRPILVMDTGQLAGGVTG